MIQLASRYTVARMMERNDFHDRFQGRHTDQPYTSFCTR
jgi:tyrosyl-tRNA synthetase